MLGFFVVALDTQIASVALPDIGSSLGGGLSGLHWVATGYTLTFSALLLFAGTLSDRTGAKRAYGMGMAVFVVASAACGFAPSLGVLAVARVAHGTGAAPITATSLTLLREAHQQSRDRARAVAYWALGGSVAAAAGPILGGLRAAANSPQRHATAATSSALSPHPPNCPVACRPTEIAQIIPFGCGPDGLIGRRACHPEWRLRACAVR
jgi:MFS family permease